MGFVRIIFCKNVIGKNIETLVNIVVNIVVKIV
jgi:hypothetical protein